MGKEIEKKYLVTDDLPDGNLQYEFIRQGYILRSENKVLRVRITGSRGFLTIKQKISDVERDEFEYEIPVKDAEEMLDQLCEKPLIRKERAFIEYLGYTWVVDKFSGENAGLMLAEIELDNAAESPPLPPWAGKEVTADPRYLNSNLALHPYNKWSEKDK